MCLEIEWRSETQGLMSSLMDVTLLWFSYADLFYVVFDS